MEDKVIYTIINEIVKEHHINALWENADTKEIDGILILNYNGHEQRFNVEIKKDLRPYQLNQIFQLAQKFYPLLVIVENLYPEIKNILKNNRIAYIDLKGNMNIEGEYFLLNVEGNRQKDLHPEKHGRAFTKVGLKAIFLFLLNDDMINDTYREIARNTGIAIGNVKLILEGLIEEGYALRKNEQNLKLTNKKELLQKWIIAYKEKLKPTLHIGNFKFANPDDFINWKNLQINLNMTYWGGEAAGNIYTDYLEPEILTLYTTERKLELMKNYRLYPDPKGNVAIFEKFWLYGQENVKVVPPIIAYADLIATNERRCLETAQKIYGKFIDNTL